MFFEGTNVFIGTNVGEKFKKGHNNVFMGRSTGSEIESCDNKIIIGDYITKLDYGQKENKYITKYKYMAIIKNKIYVSKYLFGEPNPLYNLICGSSNFFECQGFEEEWDIEMKSVKLWKRKYFIINIFIKLLEKLINFLKSKRARVSA